MGLNRQKNEWLIRVSDATVKAGESWIDFSFATRWGRQVDLPVLKSALERMAARYSTASHLKNARVVLQRWVDGGAAHGWRPPSPALSAAEAVHVLADLRFEFFSVKAADGVKLSSINALWRSFRSLLEEMCAVGLLPSLDFGIRSLRALPPTIIGNKTHGSQIPTSSVVLDAATNSFPETDSYNEDLLEPISIFASDDDYLKQYEQALGDALDTFRRCAVKDFEELVAKHSEGLARLAAVNDEFMRNAVDPGAKKAVTQRSLFAESLRHPNLIGNLLWIVERSMGGLPQPYETRAAAATGRRASRTLGPFYWRYVGDFGKNRLLPYLGVMTAASAAVCFVILLVEHPRINPSSLARARITDVLGRPSLLVDADQDDVGTRFITKKPRAKAEKAVILTPLAQKVLEHVMQWTKPARDRLQAQNRHKEAAQLWVGMSALSYDVTAYSERTLYSAFKLPTSKADWASNSRSTRAVPFLSRHPELNRWSQRVTFKGLRVSGGVLVYLRTAGDLVATAEAFGHASIKVTMQQYIPPALQHAIFERQIRRHQNLLIAAAAEDERQALAAGDFKSVEEVHEFLGNAFPDIALDNAAPRQREPAYGAEASRRNDDTAMAEIALVRDPNAVAIMLLYRDHLRHASADTLFRRDAATSVSPAFWVDIADCLTKALPIGLHDVKQVVDEAIRLLPGMRDTVRFPMLAA
jgi:hypothetical protein